MPETSIRADVQIMHLFAAQATAPALARRGTEVQHVLDFQVACDRYEGLTADDVLVELDADIERDAYRAGVAEAAHQIRGVLRE